MPQELLKKARVAGADLAEAERKVLATRGEYHTAIRRLHLAGAPLREIAEALSLSHQRVQQIVNISGGSWWRRAWRTRRSMAGAVCTWCDRPPSEVTKLVAGPNIYICDVCVTAASSVERGTVRRGPLKLAKAGLLERCTFCRKRPSNTRVVVAGPDAHICSECLRVCREIMDLTIA
jgi:hypothetical protein